MCAHNFHASGFRNRILWLTTVCFFAWIAISVAGRHWHRFKYNATVLSLETNYRSWRYPLFGITVCSNYTNDEAISAIVGKQWNISKGHAAYSYYDEFVRTIATTTYLSLHNFERYAADETLQFIDMLNVMRIVRRKYLDRLNRKKFSPIITEYGVCYTNGYFRNSLRFKPHFASDVLEKYQRATRYTYSDVMELIVSPYIYDRSANITIVSCCILWESVAIIFKYSYDEITPFSVCSQ